MRYSQLATINLETFIENTRIFLLSLSHNPAVSSPDVSECRELLSHLVSEHYAQFTSFYVADLNTNVICSAPGSHVTENLAQCEHYARWSQPRITWLAITTSAKRPAKPLWRWVIPCTTTTETLSG